MSFLRVFEEDIGLHQKNVRFIRLLSLHCKQFEKMNNLTTISRNLFAISRKIDMERNENIY